MTIGTDRKESELQRFQKDESIDPTKEDLTITIEVPKKQETTDQERAHEEIQALRREAHNGGSVELMNVRQTITEKNEASEQPPEEGLLGVRQRLEDFLATVKNVTPEEAKGWSDQTINQFAEIMNALKQYAKGVRPREEMEDIFASIQGTYGQVIRELTKKLGPGFLNRFIGTIQEAILLVEQRLNEIRESKQTSVKEIPYQEPEKNQVKGFFAKIRGLLRRK